MDNEEHLIKERMEQKRVDIADKIETLEDTLLKTVKETLTDASSVVKNVENTVENVTDSVSESVEAVKESVSESVEAVKETLHEGVEAVKSVFNISRHVDRHPWAMLGGAVILGFFGGRMLSRRRPPPRSRRRRSGAAPVTAATATPLGQESFQAASRSDASEAPAEEQSSWMGQLRSNFGEELSKLKGLAVGTTIGVLRDMLTAHAPEPLRPQLTEVMDGLTTKLGGKPFKEPLIDTSEEGEHNGKDSRSATGRPMATA